MNGTTVVAFVRRRDPNGYALRRAVRAAIVIPAVFAFASQVIGDAEVATFAAFGSFALLLFVDFPGSRAGRFGSYLMLALVGAILVSLGTLCSRAVWLATVGMVVVGFVVLFAGLLSAATAAAGRAALLTFILPVTLPADPSAIGLRLGGWALAVACSVPAALLMWPPREHDELRANAAAVCSALAASLEARLRGAAPDDCATTSEATRDALRRLRSTFRGTTYRPVGLTTGSRALVRLVEELEWLHAIVGDAQPAAIAEWPSKARDACTAAAGVLRASGQALGAGRRPTSGQSARLRQAVADLEASRAEVVAATKARLASADGMAGPYQAHEIAHAAALIGSTVGWATAADARPVAARILGRRPDGRLLGPLAPAGRVLTDHIEPHSVWLRNSVRGGLGLGLAVLVAQLAGTQHAFWVVLGAMSVLRSNALSTGSTVLRAVGGTAVGFAIGGVLVYAIGTDTTVLWLLLPLAVLFAAFAPDAISFAVGQAGFTVVVLILFNIIDPAGWKVGLVRIEDVALGCACSLVVGVLFWPRGAAGTIDRALSEAYRVGADFVGRAIEHVTHRGPAPSADFAAALAAGHRMDDALRQYLAERGVKNVPLSELTKAVNGATRLRLAGRAITALRRHDPPVDIAFFEEANNILAGRAAAIRAWYATAAASFNASGDVRTVPTPANLDAQSSVYDTLHRELIVDGPPDEDHVDHARRLLWAALYLRDLQVLQANLAPAIGQITAHPAAGTSPLSWDRRR